MEFSRKILGEWIEDKEFELYVDSWMIYYRTADEIDGHIRFPRNVQEYAVCHIAASRGASAQRQFLLDAGVEIRNRNMKKFRKANLEALRRLERGK